MANSRRKCAHCKHHQPVETMFISGLQAFCDKTHYIEYQVARKDALVNKGEKIKRANLRERKEKLKTAGEYTKEAQSAVNAYIRVRDHGKPCVSCGSMPQNKLGGTMDCGHYRSRGSASHLRFNLLNMASQCVKCNRFKSGNAVDYRIELIRRIGLDAVERIESDNTPRKFTIDYLKRIKVIFNKRARHYKKLKAIE